MGNQSQFKFHVFHEEIPLTSNGTRTLNISKGGKIQSMVLHFKTAAGASATEAQIRAEIAEIRLSNGGTDLVNATAITLLDLYEALGSEVHSNTAVNGCLELNLGRLVYSDPAVRDIFGFGTADIASLQISVKTGTLSGIASFECYTERQYGEAANEILGTYCRFVSYPQTFNATGDSRVDTLSKDSATSYLALMVSQGASGVISNGAVKVGTANLREKVPLNVNKQFLSNNRMEQPTGYFVHGFCDGSLLSRLPMLNVNDLSVTTTFTTAPGVAGYVISALTVENFPAALG